VVKTPEYSLPELLNLEWLRSNRLGAYSSTTLAGCLTRRYHGLLVAATLPPLGRVVALSTIMEQVIVGDRVYDLSTNEFPGAFSPRGCVHLQQFRDDIAATSVFEMNGITLRKRVLLSPTANAVLIRYELSDKNALLVLRPFTSLRPFHTLRRAGDAQLEIEELKQGASVRDTAQPDLPPLSVTCNRGDFHADPQWWYNLQFRSDLARGLAGHEDIYSPGVFVWQPSKRKRCKLVASLGESIQMKYKTTVTLCREQQRPLLEAIGPQPPAVRRLAVATDQFLVHRDGPSGEGGMSILAGFPWFGDWSRQTFIAFPGLLLSTGRYELARRVLGLYADFMRDGQVPYCFDDYDNQPSYGDLDVGLWYILAAERYMRRCGDDMDFWTNVLLPACKAILERYEAGSAPDAHVADDGLLSAGSPESAQTWMDVRLHGMAVTSRWGKAVEVNALWYAANAMMAERCPEAETELATRYNERARQIEQSFNAVFWNAEGGYLYDFVNDIETNTSIRPNQLLAAALPYSPLDADRRRSIVNVAAEHLLTPLGLRSLSSKDIEYHGRYAGPWETRERAYHQGTVWAWWIGAFIEAYLKAEDAANNPPAVGQAAKWLRGFDAHLNEAALGTVSEIFDGDAPHTPRGCVAHAAGVGEVLRAKLLLREYENK
jgi:predicted glycogen debranching enzyme